MQTAHKIYPAFIVFTRREYFDCPQLIRKALFLTSTKAWPCRTSATQNNVAKTLPADDSEIAVLLALHIATLT
jgi:hypothetical protein